MHSGTPESSGSPRKRTFSWGVSEDESFRNIIQEAESSSRRLTRSSSRGGTLKRRAGSQQSDQDLSMGLPEMLELQASYDQVVKELRGLKVERETLLFQVDVLKDKLEDVEELLAETQREAGQTIAELEQEKRAKKKLESMVCSLMILSEEMERLKEERNNKPSAPANTHGGVDEVTKQEHQMKNDAKELTEDSSSCKPHSSVSRVSASEEEGHNEGTDDDGSFSMNLQKKVRKPLSHVRSLAVDKPFPEDGVLHRPYESDVDDRTDSDSFSVYEDAVTPEQLRMFLGEANPFELPDDSEEGSTKNSRVNDRKTQDPQNSDACVVS